jgi:hypothetical protein
LAISKKTALYQTGPKKGRLKKGYYYDSDGTIRKAQLVVRTALYKQAQSLGQQRAVKAGQKLKSKKTTKKIKPRQRKLF